MGEAQAVNGSQRSNLYPLKSQREQLIELRQNGKDSSSVFERARMAREYEEKQMMLKGAEIGAVTGGITGGVGAGIWTFGSGAPAGIAGGVMAGAAIGAGIGHTMGKVKGDSEVQRLAVDPLYCTNLEESYNLCSKKK